ncbi:MAG: NAD(P)H-hydrate dehydratase [Anaerolineales bacterium]
MPYLLTISEMKALEAAANGAGLSYAQMMENAGRAVAEAVLARLGDDLDPHKIVVLCGQGNNGGDGLVAAHYLSNAGARVTVYCAHSPEEADGKVKRLREKSIFIADAVNDQRGRVLHNLLNSATVIVDAVFGTGARLPLTGPGAEVLRQTQAALRERSPRPFIVAVDCPSGLQCDSGALDPLALTADLTLTFDSAKRGHFVFPGADACGELAIANIGIPPNLHTSTTQLATAEGMRALLPARPRDAHKYMFGRVLVVAGSVTVTGAAYLAGLGAYRVGAGLVTLAIPRSLHPILAAQLPEATWLVLPEDNGVIAREAAEKVLSNLSKASVLLMGPGFGTEKTTGDFVRRVLEGETTRTPLGFGGRVPVEPSPASLPPMVVDADGLQLLAQIDDWPKLLPPNSVLTPHPGEMAALTGINTQTLQADRIGSARKFAAEWGHTVVFKGAFTVVAAPDGNTVVQPFATSALAHAGTGDVLAGAIAGLMAQGLTAYDSAMAATYLHGRAGELAAQRLGTPASVRARDGADAPTQALG